MTPIADRQQLYETLRTSYDIDELQALCFALNVNYQDLPGESRASKALELVLYMERRGRLAELAERIANRPPDSAHPPQGKKATTVINNQYNIGTVHNSAVGDRAQQNIQQQVQGGVMSESKKQEIKIKGSVVGSAIGGGKVEATSIAGRDVNIGQAPQTRQEFATQLAELHALIKTAVANGELTNTRDAQTVVNDVDTAVTELQEPSPRVSRLKRALEGATEILTEAAQTAQAAGKAGLAILKAAPIARALLSVAETIFS